MLILGMDTTGNTLSVALCKDEKLLCEIYIDTTKKHSKTLMQAVDSVLRFADTDVLDVDVFACASGPGSFTGIRIGVATCCAMAHAAKKPIASVNTLEALIKNADGQTAVCAVMDARRQEVYALAKKGETYLVEQGALPLLELIKKLPEEPVLFVGDGAVVYKDMILQQKPNSLFLQQQFIMQRGSSVCVCAYGLAQAGKLLRYDEVQPQYLRESQAERLRKENLG
ncbi:MAG: tRNA (adenosine(37)-N6)-threonylcarbamoyltransferase complex dimerization subunit type 1 TsaB [Christensenellaceae bacterium]